MPASYALAGLPVSTFTSMLADYYPGVSYMVAGDWLVSVLYKGWSPGTYWLVSFIAAILLFVSVLLHELAHSVVARAHGLST